MPELYRKTKRRLAVSNEDLKQLRESGLNNETIIDNGLKTKKCALYFPYHNLRGKRIAFTRWRPHKPRLDKDGKCIKYEQEQGTTPHAYFPKSSRLKLRDGKSDTYITEGEKKSLAMSQCGLPTIGIGGVWCWKVKGTDLLIDDLKEIEWSGRNVYLVFDYDEKPKTQRQVQTAGRRLAKALRAAGAKEVFWVSLPPGPDGAKQGVDDFLVAHGKTAFKKLIAEAKPVPTDEVPSLAKTLGQTDAANAKRLIAKFGDEIRHVGAWDKWILWDGRRWAMDQHYRIEALAKTVAADLWDEIKAAYGTVDSDTIKRMIGWAKYSNSANGVANMLKLARSEPGVAIGVDELDTDPWLLRG